MSIMMAVDLLGCTGSTEERAALLHKTIQLAAELKNNLGNMFGFAAVMRALELPQVNLCRICSCCIRFLCTNGKCFHVVIVDLPLGADVGDFTAETHRGRHSVRKETQALHEEHERWKR